MFICHVCLLGENFEISFGESKNNSHRELSEVLWKTQYSKHIPRNLQSRNFYIIRNLPFRKFTGNCTSVWFLHHYLNPVNKMQVSSKKSETAVQRPKSIRLEHIKEMARKSVSRRELQKCNVRHWYTWTPLAFLRPFPGIKKERNIILKSIFLRLKVKWTIE